MCDFEWQPAVDLEVYSDTDFAGCLETRRSTSGGVALRGRHLIKHLSVTQKSVTLSSGEAELGGIVKGTTEVLWDPELRPRPRHRHARADSAAARGICKRSGGGRRATLPLAFSGRRKGCAEETSSYSRSQRVRTPDAVAKHMARDAPDKLVAAMSVRCATGRASTAPKARVT